MISKHMKNEKRMNDRSIGPQEKYMNLRRDKDLKDSFHEVLPHVKFPSKPYMERDIL